MLLAALFDQALSQFLIDLHQLVNFAFAPLLCLSEQFLIGLGHHVDCAMV